MELSYHPTALFYLAKFIFPDGMRDGGFLHVRVRGVSLNLVITPHQQDEGAMAFQLTQPERPGVSRLITVNMYRDVEDSAANHSAGDTNDDLNDPHMHDILEGVYYTLQWLLKRHMGDIQVRGYA